MKMDNRPWDLTIFKYFIKHAIAVYSLAVLYAVSSFNMPEACRPSKMYFWVHKSDFSKILLLSKQEKKRDFYRMYLMRKYFYQFWLVATKVLNKFVCT